ncbi:MAG: OB-fold putative lipoprotein [Pseudomonadota bacterium]|nr:OB-fold putative lipoprotein [Pseudomonadota bacterium]
MPPLREFCPKCGTPTDPDLRESLLRRRGGRPVEEQKRNRKTFLIGGAAILLALGVAGNLSWPGLPISIDFDDRDRPGGPVTIEAEQLYQAYRDDPDAAAKRFDGREMEVSGEFLRIVPDGWGSLDLRLKTSNPEEPLGIDVTQLAIEEAKQLRPGQRVTVSCQQMGSGGDELWVQDCAIQPTGEGSAAPSPPASPSPPAPPPAPKQGNSG